jgi:hypothetical protein
MSGIQVMRGIGFAMHPMAKVRLQRLAAGSERERYPAGEVRVQVRQRAGALPGHVVDRESHDMLRSVSRVVRR